MKKIGFLFLVFGFMQKILAEEMFSYSQSMDCYVKEYENKTFKNVSDDYFVGKPLRIVELKKTQGFVAFKVNGKLYVAPKKCLTSVSDTTEKETAPKEEPNQFLTGQDKDWEEDNYNKRKENIERKKNERLRETKFVPRAIEKKYFVELFGGKTFGGSKKPVSNESSKYITFSGEEDFGNGMETFVLAPISVRESSKAKSSLGGGAKFGYKNDSENYFVFQFKSTKVEKSETINYQLTPASTSVSFGPILYKWNFNVSQLYLGYSFCLSCTNGLAFYLNTLLGVNNISAKVKVEDVGNYSFNATTIGGEFGLNALYVLSNWFSLSLNIGYDLQSGGTYKLKGTENNEVANGFKSGLSLGGPFTNLGVRVHF